MINALNNIDFRFYFWLFLRRLPLFLTVVVLTAGLGIALTLLWPPSYQATAKILVESPQIPADLAKSTVPTSAAEQFQIIQEDVLSRENLLALADKFAIYSDAQDMTRTDMFDDMKRRIEIVPTPVETATGSAVATVFHISFKAHRPQVAADLVNDLVTMILNKDVQLRTARATDTVTFFTQESQRLDGELRAVDSRILAFKSEHIDAMPDSIDFRRNQQTAQQQRLLALAQEETTLRRQQTELQLRPLEITAVPATPEEQSLLALQQALAQQQLSFAEDSPTIQALRTRIAALQKTIQSPPDANAAPLNSRDIQLADISERLAAIGEERAEINKSIANLTTSIAATPGNETMLNSLQRDHQNLQAQYDAAIARLADASTGQQIEFLLKGERLSLIDSAVPPQVRQGPGQKTLILASLGAALLAGLATILAPELLNRRIRRPDELAERLQIVPFVTVPYIDRRFRPARLAVGVGMVVAMPLLLLAQPGNLTPQNNLSTPTLAAIGVAGSGVQEKTWP
ncbi:MAG: hypothetical protein ABS76_09705 [Pelagibacterium sp. SCN 64-44]|nr:MAG: hypothetical protein ABS76_09705 [Pelagibacterium sp. SCN 64-44]